MEVTVKLFAMLTRYSPGETGRPAGTPFPVTLPEGSTVADLVTHLGIPDREVKVAFVDGRARAMLYRLSPGAEVGIFPPIGGG
jgi:sulfur carrier protein ThiS